MMMAAGGPIVLLMALAGGGGDIVSLLSAKDYFEVRQIEPSVAKLIELAGTEPTTGKVQIAQLFALRHLAADAAEVKKSPKAAEVRELLRQIAGGKKANDATGFAAEYAARALVAIDGGKEPMPKRGDWREGAAWLPKDITLFGGFDSKGQGPGASPDFGPALASMPKQAKEQMYQAIEKIGNVRMERAVFGMKSFGEKGGDSGTETYVRFTGKANPKWIADALADSGKMTERVVAGRPVKIFEQRYNQPSMAIVGDSDFLVAGVSGRTTVKRAPGTKESKEKVVEPDTLAHLEKMFALMAQPGEDVTKGSLKADLAKLPAGASAVLIGAIPEDMKRGAPFPMPEKILAHATRSPGGLDIRVAATMNGENDAKQMVQTIAQGRDSALKQLVQMKGQPLPVPGVNLDSITSVLESIQLQSDGNGVQIQMLVPPDAMLNLLPAMMLFG